ncbi:prepilin peptidase [Vibrio sp. CAIM 722]|uniref:Prepilin peptidase n=1 Tax=Vibrio eleionomae TaxID=2653505 RepID=A0A7X4RU17_9VIBR|nr:primosomal replication protein [Vibrio eleionomae]MZI92782.1 prepilin peptidase [Vibrio eleionomae]
MKDFSHIRQLLETLSVQAANLDRQRGEHHLPLFDDILFHCHAKLLTPCVQETKSTLESLIREQDSKRLTQSRAEYLTERLLAQISAIQREISTTSVRSHEPKHASYYRKPISTLYQELAQHQEWERRLADMVQDKQYALDNAPFNEKQIAQSALLAVEQRLKRCQTAKTKLENQITYRERNQ